MIESGEIDTLAPAFWNLEINKAMVYASADVMQKGEFEKGE